MAYQIDASSSESQDTHIPSIIWLLYLGKNYT